MEIQSKIDRSMMKIRMVDTNRGHYAIILKTKEKPVLNLLLLDDVTEDVPVLFLEGAEEDLCSFKALRKVN